MDSHFYFFIALAFIFVHEMDAIRQHEWRMFPLTSWLKEKTSFLIFMGLHVPLYVLLLWNLYTPNGLNKGLIQGLDIFFIIHVVLHLLFLKHPKNEFNSIFSWIIILGAGVAGFIDLFASF